MPTHESYGVYGRQEGQRDSEELESDELPSLPSNTPTKEKSHSPSSNEAMVKSPQSVQVQPRDRSDSGHRHEQQEHVIVTSFDISSSVSSEVNRFDVSSSLSSECNFSEEMNRQIKERAGVRITSTPANSGDDRQSLSKSSMSEEFPSRLSTLNTGRIEERCSDHSIDLFSEHDDTLTGLETNNGRTTQ